MRKVILLSVLSLMLTFGASAKGISIFDFGVKAGVMTSSVNFPKTNLSGYDLTASSALGYQVGLMAKVSLMSMHLQPEILYTMNRFKLNLDNGNSNADATIRMNSFEVPLAFGYHFLFFNLNFGPVFNLSTASSVAKSEGLVDSVISIKPSIGYMAGVSVELEGFVIDARYNGYFKKTAQALTIGDATSEYDMAQSNWMFTLGYLF